MAWSGTPVIKSLGKYTVRITGVFLDGDAVGTIGLAGSGADLELPANFPTTPGVNRAALALTMSDIVQCRYVNTDPGGGAESRHVHVEKADSPFTITFTNDAAGNPTSPLEIYVEYTHSENR